MTWGITKDATVLGYYLNSKKCGSLLMMYLDICLLKIVVNAFCSHFHVCGELWWKHCELLVGIKWYQHILGAICPQILVTNHESGASLTQVKIILNKILILLNNYISGRLWSISLRIMYWLMSSIPL